MVKDTTDEVQKRQLKWSEHTNRMDEARWLQKVVEGVPQEKREGGRPRRVWRYDVKERTDARDRAEGVCYRREGWRLGAEKRHSCKVMCKYIYHIQTILLPLRVILCKLAASNDKHKKKCF
jgi:hypothetical protein